STGTHGWTSPPARHRPSTRSASRTRATRARRSRAATPAAWAPSSSRSSCASRDPGLAMSGVVARRAGVADVAALVRLRRESSEEDLEPGSGLVTFDERMAAFLERAVADPRWRIFVGEVDGEVVATAYMQVIPKVPRPWPNPPWGYVTTVFTRAAFRDRGVG